MMAGTKVRRGIRAATPVATSVLSYSGPTTRGIGFSGTPQGYVRNDVGPTKIGVRGVRFYSRKKMSPRFELYVKQSSTGGDRGSCPFCMRVYMFMLHKVTPDQIQTVPVDFANKTENFLALNPAGTTPVLIDHGADDKVISDSGLIVEYMEQLYPSPCMKVGCNDPAVEAAGTFFGKFAAYIKNQDLANSPQLRQQFETEMQKFEDFLQNQGKDHKYLLGDNFSEIDCSVLPKLLQVKAAGLEYKGVDIGAQFPAVAAYIERASAVQACQNTRPTDAELIQGWARYGAIKEC